MTGSLWFVIAVTSCYHW